MKPALGLAVNKLGHDYIIAWSPVVTQTTHSSLRSRTCTTPPTPKNNQHIVCITT